MIFLLEAFSFLWLASEIGEILVCVFHCCNKSHPHKFMALLTTYGFNFPICSSGPRHSTHFVLYFSWLEVLIPRGWIFTSERGPSNAKFLVKLSLHLPLRLLNLKLQCHLHCFELWPFIEVCQNTWLMNSLDFFCFIYWGCLFLYYIQSSMVLNNRH